MKKLEIVRVHSQDGEIHFILREHKADRNFENRKYVDEGEVKEVMRKEAGKPLLLLREE